MVRGEGNDRGREDDQGAHRAALRCDRTVAVDRLGATDNDIRRMVRRKDLVRVHQGVFVNHSGELSWRQRAWAAVLAHEPAALAGGSALSAHGVRGISERGPVQVCIDANRSVRAVDGVTVARIASFEDRCQLQASPPRERLEYAVLGEAARKRTPDQALALVADVVQQGKSTPRRLIVALDALPRLRHRALLREILADVAAGTYSVLEHRYLTDVERPHGLPTAERQRRVKPGRTVAFRDVDYVDLGTCVELDGRIGHEEALDRWADLQRDLDAAAAGDLTVRIGWKQVLDPCRLAEAIGTLLQARGWNGEAGVCGEACQVGRRTAA